MTRRNLRPDELRVFTTRTSPARRIAVGLALTATLLPRDAGAVPVEDVVTEGCTTTIVEGLSLQIIGQAQCIEPNAFTEVPAQPNVTFGPAVFPYLEAPARDAFVAAVQSQPGLQMTVNSMLRTVAQQYLLYRWYQLGLCGIGLAASPGASNHETGLALDISEYNAWNSPLTAEGFSWFGSGDPVHFTYTAPGATDHRGLDVEAFQLLHNLNHPEDPIEVDGDWGPQTEARMLQAPAEGFAVGPPCKSGPNAPRIVMSLRYDSLRDQYDDGASSGLVDTWEGDRFRTIVTLTNAGTVAAERIELGVQIPSTFIRVDDYAIESKTPKSLFSSAPENANSKNPAHLVDLQNGAVFELDGLDVGQTKRIVLDSVGVAASVTMDPPPSFGAWVRSLDDFYTQDAIGAAPSDPQGSQTFNGGVLEAIRSLDVYSDRRWLWDTERREGWSGTVAEPMLQSGSILIPAAGGGIASPPLDLLTQEAPVLYLAGDFEAAPGDILVSFRTASMARGERSEPIAVRFGEPIAESLRFAQVDLRASPSYEGALRQIWIHTDAPSSLALTAASFTPLDDVDFGLGTHGNAVDDEGSGDDDGCACGIPGSSSRSSPIELAVALIGLTALIRRRPRWLRGSRSRACKRTTPRSPRGTPPYRG